MKYEFDKTKQQKFHKTWSILKVGVRLEIKPSDLIRNELISHGSYNLPLITSRSRIIENM